MTQLLVLIPAWVLGDGSVLPPARGDLVGYPLGFHEHDLTNGQNPTTQDLSAHCSAGPPHRRHRGSATWSVWPTTLTGTRWTAHWSAPRELSGPVQVHGALVVDPMLVALDPQSASSRATAGTVIDLHVVSAGVQARADDPQRGTIPGSTQLQPVAAAPRWLDNGPTRSPTRSGCHSYSDLQPDDQYRRETGVPVTLDLRRPDAVDPRAATDGVVAVDSATGFGPDLPLGDLPRHR